MGRQIKARMILHEMTPYSTGTKADREAWADLVLGVEELLPLAAHIPESLAEESLYLWDRTGGSIGALRGLLSDAAIGAILEGTEKIDRRRLEATATDYAAQEHHRSQSKSGASKSKKRGLRMAQ